VSVLYIGGEGRSGSTLLSSLLGNHEGFFPVGEFRDVWQALKTNESCGCGELFLDCEFWQQVGLRAFGGWDGIDVQRMLDTDNKFARQRRVPRLLLLSSRWFESRGLAEYRRLLAELYVAVQGVSGCSVIVDSTKDPAYALLLSRVPGVDLRVVHLVRDSRGVAYSWSKKDVERPEYAQHPVLKGSFMGSRSSWRGALEWDVKNSLFHLLSLSPHHRLVKYEALMSQPMRELEGILRLADKAQFHPGDEHSPRREFESLPFHTLGGNRVRFKRGPITLNADEEWKSKMPRSQRLIVGALTLPLLAAYGYVSPRARPRRAP